MLYELIKDSAQRLGTANACKTVGASRSGYCAWLNRELVQEDETLLNAIQDIAKAPCYGYRRIKETLGKPPYNQVVNRKKVLRIMRETGLLCKRKKAFKPKTTDSKRGHRKYPNLVKNMVVTGVNQVWVSDITYIYLANGELVYLADVMDQYSRKCLGWQLSRNIDAQLCVDALKMALNERNGVDLTGLNHHSDGGSQYGSKDYETLLDEHGIRGSMGEGSAYDNPFAESFFKTVKYEEVYVNEYESFAQAYADIKRFIEVVYNKKRLHSSIGYMSPDEFEQQVLKVAGS